MRQSWAHQLLTVPGRLIGTSRASRLRVLSPRYAFSVTALDTKTGRVQSKTTARYTSRDFVASRSRSYRCARIGRRFISSSILPPSGSRFPRTSSAGAVSPPHLFFLAQPSRTLVCQNRTRDHCPPSSPRVPIWLENCVATLTPTQPTLARFGVFRPFSSPTYQRIPYDSPLAGR